MLFLSIIIIAHILYALAFVGDKFALGRSVTHPSVYVFFVNLLGGIGTVFWFFDLQTPNLTESFIGIAAGFFFVIGTYLFFQTLKETSASKATPLFGGFTAIFTVLISFFLGERLNASQIFGISMLIIALFLFAVIETKKIKSELHKHSIIMAGASMAISVVLYSYFAKIQGFYVAFAIVRLSAAVFVSLFLISAVFRKCLKIEFEKTRSTLQKAAVFPRIFGAAGNILIAFAMSIGSPSVVQSMQGVQYILILPLAIIASKRFPKVYNETVSHQALLIKICAIILITAGLFLIAFNL